MRRPSLVLSSHVVAGLALICVVAACSPQPTAGGEPSSSAPSVTTTAVPGSPPAEEPALPTTLVGATLLPAWQAPNREFSLLVGSSSFSAVTDAFSYPWAGQGKYTPLPLRPNEQVVGVSGAFVLAFDDGLNGGRRTLVRVDLRDGSTTRREVPGGGDWAPLFADADGWIVQAYANGGTGALVRVPADPGADVRTLITTDTVEAASTAGALIVQGGQLVLNPLEGSAPMVLESGLATDASSVPPAVALVGDAAAWWNGATQRLSYRELPDGSTVSIAVDGLTYPRLAVVRGAVAVLTDDGGLRVWLPGAGRLGDAIPLDADSWGEVRPAARPDGGPAFVVEVLAPGADDMRWVLIDAVTGAVVRRDPGRAAYFSVLGAAGSHGRAAIQYSGTTFREDNGEAFLFFDTVVVRTIPAGKRVASVSRVPMGSHITAAVDGRLAAVVSVTGTGPHGKDRVLLLRDGGPIGTARVGPSPVAVSTSGGLTAVAGGTTDDARLPSAVVDGTGRVVAPLPDGTVSVSQDGARTAFATADGQVGVLDVAGGHAALSTIAQVCAAGSDCTVHVALSGGRLLIGVAGPSTYSGAVESDSISVYALGTASAPRQWDVPGGSAASAVLSGDLVLVQTADGRLLSLDLATGSGEFVPRLATAAGYQPPAMALAGDFVLWCPADSTLSAGCPALAVAPVPDTWGRVAGSG